MQDAESARKIATEFYANYHVNGSFNFPLWEKLLAEDFVHANAPPGHGDKAGYVRLRRMATGLADAKTRVLEVVAEGDRAAVHWETSFRHAGEVLGVPATGRTIRAQGICLVQVRGGQIVRAVEVSNQLDALMQMKA